MELESRTLSEMNQLVFKCVKCGTIFCQESSRHFASKLIYKIVYLICISILKHFLY